ncbi:hypothetical protein ACHAWF_016705 [Thalassiosira exigua]
MWGGLRPIRSRLILDVLTIAVLLCCSVAPPDEANNAALVAACAVTVASAGLTSRWPISFPLAPLLALQGLRRFEWVANCSWTAASIGVLSALLIAISVALTILFPAVELRPINGKYHVGVVDLHLPVDFTESVRRGSLLGTQHQDDHGVPSKSHVSARLLYPTDEEPEHVPYLDPESSPLLCDEMMKAGAPGPLKAFGWMLHTWRLTTIRAKRNALPARENKFFPLSVFSHGLMGISSIYSYQASNLAAEGFVVLMVEHTDASAVAVKRRDSSHLLYDSSLVSELQSERIRTQEYETKRRVQTQHRVEECLSALRVLRKLNCNGIPDLDALGISFVNKLDVSDVTLIGHSFGGCTVLSAAAQRPDLVSAVVAHEPVVSWMPDDARQSLLSVATKEGEEKKNDSDGEGRKESIHDVDMLFLYSEEWAEKGWGAYHQIKELHDRQKLGPKGGTSEVGVISKAKHQEFSDTCMLTPLWLARATGLTGERNPHDTAEEIGLRTVNFLHATRLKRQIK